MKFQTALVPHGQYEAVMMSRHSIGPRTADSNEGGIEIGFTIAKGPFSNQPLTCKVWAPQKKQRARSFKAGTLLKIHVIQHRLDDGRRVNRVIDFHAAANATVIEAMSEGSQPAAGGCGLEIAAEGQAGIPVALRRRLLDAARGTATSERAPLAAAPVLLASMLTAGREQWAAEYSWGFHRCGGKSGTRKIVEYEGYLQSYTNISSAAASAGDAYLAVYQYSKNLTAYQQASEKWSLAGYRGGAWARWLAFDLDGDGTEAGLERALRDAHRLVDLLRAIGIPQDLILVFFSGQKGVHILFLTCPHE